MSCSALIGGANVTSAMGCLDKASAFWLTLPGQWTILKSYALSSNDQHSRCWEWALLVLEDSSHSNGSDLFV